MNRSMFLGLTLLLAAPVAHAQSCTSSGNAKTDGTYPHDESPCTLNADNYYNEYLPNLTPTTATHFPTALVDFAGTTSDGHLMKLIANRVGACPNAGGTCASSFFEGSDPSGSTNETQSRANVAIYNPGVTQNGKLLVMLPGHGALPRSYTQFAVEAAHHGYHVIVLMFINEARANACNDYGLDATKGITGGVDECITQITRYKLDGTSLGAFAANVFNQELSDDAPGETTSAVDSVENRLGLLLAWLNESFPTQGWGAFITTFRGFSWINWSLVAIAGHSMGSNLAAMIASEYPVDRMLTFSGPQRYLADKEDLGCDYEPSFLTPAGVTPPSKQYLFVSSQDTTGSYTMAVNAALCGALLPDIVSGYIGPSYIDNGDPLVDHSRLLITSVVPSGCEGHTSVVTNCNQSWPYHYRPVWDFMLTNP